MKGISSTKILGTKVSTEKSGNILKYIITRLTSKRGKLYIVTPNPEIMVLSKRDRSYQEVLNRAEIALPDGVGVLMASKLLKRGVEERITGTDFMVLLCRECARESLTVGFLGGRGDVAKRTADCLRDLYPGLKVVYAGEEWDVRRTENGKWKAENGDELIHIDLLFVAFGFPKQEKWIAKNLNSIPVTCAMGVGGAFDYVSGQAVRAPRFLRNLGFEWLFRLIAEPWRLKRQLSLPVFAYYLVKEKIVGAKND